MTAHVHFAELVRDLCRDAGCTADTDDERAQWLAGRIDALRSAEALLAGADAVKDLVERQRLDLAIQATTIEQLTSQLHAAREELRRLARNSPSAAD